MLDDSNHFSEKLDNLHTVFTSESQSLPHREEAAFSHSPRYDGQGIATLKVAHENNSNSLEEALSILRRAWTPTMAFAHKIVQQLEHIQGTTTSPSSRPTPQSIIGSVILRLPSGLYNQSQSARTVLKLYEQYQVQLSPDANLNSSTPQSQIPYDRRHEALEICEICDASINLESALWARCTNSHQFGKTL